MSRGISYCNFDDKLFIWRKIILLYKKAFFMY